MLQTDRPKSDNGEWCMHIACWIPKVTNTQLRICNTYYFPTATVTTQIHISGMFIRTLPACLVIHICCILLAVSNCCVEDEGSGKETVGKT